VTESGRIAILFDIDGTLITTGGAGAAAWRLAFDELYGVPADIGRFTDAGMTDPEVGRLTFEHVVGREPNTRELARLLARRNHYMRETVAESKQYAVLPGVTELLPRLGDEGFLLGVTTGNVEAAAHIKLARADLNHYFCFGGYGSDSTDRLELTRRALERAAILAGQELDREQALVVGDTPHDVNAANGAGAVSVGVATGHFGKQDLKRAGADYVLGSLEEDLPL